MCVRLLAYLPHIGAAVAAPEPAAELALFLTAFESFLWVWDFKVFSILEDCLEDLRFNFYVAQ